MHVIIVADHGRVNGGQSKVAIDSALGLVARGHRITCFIAVGPIDPRLAQAGIEVICLDQVDIETTTSQFAFLKQTMWNTKAKEALAALLATCDPDDTVVHVHAWPKALSPSIGPAIANSKLACVYTMHEFFLSCPNGGFYDYQAQAVCLRAPLSMACVTTNCDSRTYAHKLVRVARQVLLNQGGLPDAIDRIITISRLQVDVAGAYYPERAIVQRVDNPVQATDLGPRTEIGDRFLYVGRVSPEKGVQHFCEAARRAGVRPLIVGDGPSLADLRARYPEAEFLGWRKSEDVLALMRQARAFVFPSVWYETLGLTALESLAMGTPVIVSDVCAARESVVDGVSGLWFKSADPDALAQAITQLRDDDTAARMSAEAYARYWAAPRTMERHVAGLEEVYALALGDSARRRA
jgi:glycosyltransferase involved in cell wall biosynthesis